MIFSGSLGIGYGIIEKKKKDINIIERWEFVFQMFISEIIYKKQTLNYACMEIGRKIEGAEGKLLIHISKRMDDRQGVKFGQIWEEECEKYGKTEKVLSTEIDVIKEFGKMTGFEDEDIQKRMIEIQMEKWKSIKGKKQEELQERKRLILSLSPCVGLLIILILW